jgi:hypothetical protein
LIALVFAIGILPQQFILNFIKTPTRYIVAQVDPQYAPARQTAVAPLPAVPSKLQEEVRR